MEHLAIFIIVAVFWFFISISMYGNEKYPNFNNSPIQGFTMATFIFYIIIELLIFAIKILIN